MANFRLPKMLYVPEIPLSMVEKKCLFIYIFSLFPYIIQYFFINVKVLAIC